MDPYELRFFLTVFLSAMMSSWRQCYECLRKAIIMMADIEAL